MNTKRSLTVEARRSLKAEVDRVIALSTNSELGHIEEDALHRSLIDQFCPGWVTVQVKRLTEAEFPRWYS